mgnify:CR=1 FL=1
MPGEQQPTSPHSWQNLAGPAVIGRPPAGGLEFFAGTPRPTAPMAGDRPPRVDEAEVLGILDAGLGLSRGDPRAAETHPTGQQLGTDKYEGHRKQTGLRDA